VILHFGWHCEPPLVSWVYSERVLTSRVPLLLRGSRGRPQGSNSTSSEFAQEVKGADSGRSGSGAKLLFTGMSAVGTFRTCPAKLTMSVEGANRTLRMS